MEGGPRWWILSKNKTPNNTAVIIKIINTVKKVVWLKRAPIPMFFLYNRRLLPLVVAG